MKKIIERNERGQITYRRASNGNEAWREYDDAGHETHYRDSDGYEAWYDYDAAGNLTHYRKSNGCEYWYINGIEVTRERWEEHYGRDN